MEKEEFDKENKYLNSTIELVKEKIDYVNNYSSNVNKMFDNSNKEYFEYLNRNANKINEEDIVELLNMQGRLGDLQNDTIDLQKSKEIYDKMLSKPYFASLLLRASDETIDENYYIGLHSLVNDNDEYKVLDWRSPIASIFYDVEEGKCQIKTDKSILNCVLDRKRQFGIENGKLSYYIDSTINIEDDILKEALAKNTSNQMKSIVQTIQKEQNSVIRGDEYKDLIVQGVAGSGKTAIALHRIAYLLYKMKGKIKSENINFISPNNAFSSYISSVLPDLAEDDIDKVQLDNIARRYLKNHLIVERKFEQIERLINSQDLSDYKLKTSYEFLEKLIDFAKRNYIDNFDIEDFQIQNTVIDSKKIKELFYGKYSDRDLFTRLRWITDNIFDLYFYKVKSVDKTLKFKQYIFMKLYQAIENKNCVKAYMNFLKSIGKKLELVGDKVKNEDVYGILFFKMFIYGLDKEENIKYLVIDEMQDYSAVQLYILHYIYDCPLTMLGDYNQTLDIDGSNKLIHNISKILGDDSVYVELNKTYRSSQEIVEFYNKIGGKQNVNFVNRSAEKVDFIKTNNSNEIDILMSKINDLKSKGYNSIAIITKTNAIAKELGNKFEDKNIDINLIDDNIDNYDNGTCIISIYNSKGLEFDGVIIYNVGSEYSTILDRNLLYIASTRALHSLTISCNEDKFSSLLDCYLEEK